MPPFRPAANSVRHSLMIPPLLLEKFATPASAIFIRAWTSGPTGPKAWVMTVAVCVAPASPVAAALLISAAMAALT
jgi:hypothetical protein